MVVYTDQPLKKVLHKPYVSGQLAAWVMELTQSVQTSWTLYVHGSSTSDTSGAG